MAERIGEAKPALASSIKTVTRRIEDQASSLTSVAEASRMETDAPALNGNDTGQPASAATGGIAIDPAEGAAVGSTTAVAARPKTDVPQKPRLLDRLAGLSKS